MMMVSTKTTRRPARREPSPRDERPGTESRKGTPAGFSRSNGGCRRNPAHRGAECCRSADALCNPAMSFGRNPHVAKAETAEQKAGVAPDDRSRERAWREAAHLWDRAADRESDEKRRTQYAQRAEAARAKAEAAPEVAVDRATRVAELTEKLRDPRSLN